jgi:hypothetical protein
MEVVKNGKLKKFSPSGYIEERLKTLRKHLSAGEKAHKPHQKRLRMDAAVLTGGSMTGAFGLF